MNLQELTAKYAKTVHTDPTTKETYIKIPITDPCELGFMQQTLLDNLYLLSQLDDKIEYDRSFKDNVYWLSKILIASYPYDELEGISKLIKAASKLM